jgi:hypothetical protein
LNATGDRRPGARHGDSPIASAGDVRYAVASAPGVLYRLAGRSPDPNVSDDVLADRIRSGLGPLEKRLDVPRVHVIVEDHVAIVHGDVPNELAACAIERAIMRISGVKGVESHLHPGLVGGDTRPSQGAAVPQPPSAALSALLGAARDAGAGMYPRAAVHAVRTSRWRSASSRSMRSTESCGSKKHCSARPSPTTSFGALSSSSR